MLSRTTVQCLFKLKICKPLVPDYRGTLAHVYMKIYIRMLTEALFTVILKMEINIH